MALMQCPECGGQVSDQALACPHCGYQLQKTVKKSEITKTAEESEKNNKAASGCLTVICCLLMLVVFIFVVVTMGNSSGSKKSSVKTPDDIKAFAAVTMHIRNNYYSNAKLTQRNASITHDGNKYSISGTFTTDGIVHRYSIVLSLGADTASIISCTVK